MTPEASSVAPLRAHIIDDDAGDRKMLRRALNASVGNAEISESESIADALDRRDGDAIDLVLLDYRIGDCNGLSGLQLIKEAWPTSAVVMVTGNGDEQLATSALHSGAVDYVPKRRIREASIKTVVENAIETSSRQRKIAEQHEYLISFSHMLAHEFVSPIISIEDLAVFALENAEARDDVSLCLNEILKCAQSSRKLIRSLTEHIRLEGTVALELCSLQQLLENAMASLRTEIADSGAVIEAHGLPAVLGNPAVLTLLLKNLISNAIKYNESAVPTISITAAPPALGCDAGMVTVRVSDNGIGIVRDHADVIFEPFKRLHGDSKYSGTGLGLATCRKIVQRHGGRIWCEPGMGAGTVFLFTLKAHSSDSGAASDLMATN